ncbi:MAG: hypothetical protein CSA81_08450 [Acidobacteria bacterium]|nr:MAG: hypothetical protein CSA81_08450 [Acidobacteriota bacterium]
MTKGIKRRDFLALMGLSGAAATLSCSEEKFTEKWDPWVKPVPGMLPRKAWHYPTTTRECGANGLWVKTLGGRATRINGNPKHPLTQGKMDGRMQSIVQGLYSPNRLKAPVFNGKEISWEEARKVLDEHLGKVKGGGVFALTGAISGITKDIWSAFVATHGSTGKLVQFEAFANSSMREASERVFGKREVPLYSLEGIDMVVSFGADFLETWGNPVFQQKSYADFKADFEHRGPHYQLEPKMTVTGANADKWAGIRPGSETLLALAVLKELAVDSHNLSETEKELVTALTSNVVSADAVKQSGMNKKAFQTMVDKLKHAKHAVALPAGDLALGNDGVFHHVALLLINKALGSIGKHVNYNSGLSGDNQVVQSEMLSLIDSLNAGKVDFLIIKDTNPVYVLPEGLGTKNAIEKAGFSVAFADVLNETNSLANLILPGAHDLESWGEVVSYKGINMLMQPVMTPRWELYQAEDILLSYIEKAAPGTFVDNSVMKVLKDKWVKTYAAEGADPEKAWRGFLKDGGHFDLKLEGEDLAVSENLTGDFFSTYKPQTLSGKALVVIESGKFGDGTSANRNWLQELPDRMTGIVWDSWVEVARKTGKKEGWQIGDVITISAKGVDMDVPVMLTDTIAEDVFCLQTGQGHTGYGKLYNRGINAFAFYSKKTNDLGDLVMGPMAAKVSLTGRKHRFSMVNLPEIGERLTQPLSKSKADVEIPLYGGEAYDRDIYQWTTLDELHHGGHHGHGHGVDKTDPKYLASEFPVATDTDWYDRKPRTETPVVVGRDETFYDDYKWEMTIDLNRCDGCSACTVACYAENNIQVVGKDQVGKGRIMSWVRINRYITFHKKDDQLETKVHFMPMACQQCGSAPCETVCPSLATYHTKEGLNAMVYNRCIGTRYCANNCVYKTRRFNWFDAVFDEDLAWQLNPEVSVRSRGVMEKCTFCIQTINKAKDEAKDKGRKVQDGDFKITCQEVCPCDAITFGNASDPNSLVSKTAKNPRSYQALDHHLHTRPGIHYLKKVEIDDSGKHA